MCYTTRGYTIAFIIYYVRACLKTLEPISNLTFMAKWRLEIDSYTYGGTTLINYTSKSSMIKKTFTHALIAVLLLSSVPASAVVDSARDSERERSSEEQSIINVYDADTGR